MTRAWLAATALLLLTAWPAAAQRRVELGIGGGLAGGASLGTLDATLTSNNTAGSPFRLFSSDTRLAPAAVIEGRIGYRATPRLTIEGILTVGTPELRTSLTGDVENAANVEATEAVTEYVVTAGASWRLWTNPRRRWVPFVSGGAGVARHVHAGPSLIESGVDGRLHLLSGGLAEGSDVSTRGTITGSIFVTF